MLPDKPSTREELYLDSIATNNTAELPAKPCTRKEQYLEYIALNGGKGAAIVEVTGESGTLTAEQIADVLKDDVTIECDGKMFRLANKMSTLTYRTFICVDAAQSSDLAVSAIYVQIDEDAANYGSWSKEDVPTGGGPEIVELEEGKSSGNLTADDIAKLENPNTYIKLTNEYGLEKYYRLAQRSYSGDYYMANYTCLYDGMIAWAQFEEVLITVYKDGSRTSTWNKQSMTYN